MRAGALQRPHDFGRAAADGNSRDRLHRARGSRRYVRQGPEARAVANRIRNTGTAFLRHGGQDRDRYAYRRIPQPH